MSYFSYFHKQPKTHIHYNSVVCQDMIYTCAPENIMELPRISQSVLNSSSLKKNNKNRGLAGQVALEFIAGEKVKRTRAKKAIAAFHLRKDMVLGCAVKLRNFHCYHFLDQYVTTTCAGDNAVSSESANLLSLHRKVELTKKRGEMSVNVTVNRFECFPGLESHFLFFSGIGGVNCTLSFYTKGWKELRLLLTALQLPVKI